MFTLQFGDYTFPNISFELEGQLHNNNVKEETIVQRHGAIVQTPFLKAKRLKIKGFIHDPTNTVNEQTLADMQQSLLAGEKAFRYRSDREINSYVRKLDPKFVLGTDKSVMEIDIELIAQVPFYQSVGAPISTVQAITGTTVSFTVNNEGNAFAEPIIYIFADNATMTDAFQITNQSNGDQQSKFRGIIANGTTLKLTTEDLSALNNSVAALTQFEGNFIQLLAGTNTLQVVADNCQVTIEHKHRWF